MRHISFLVVAFTVVLVPQVISCAEARPVDATVGTEGEPLSKLVSTSQIKLKYGDSDQAPGFRPAGEDLQAMGPNNFEVKEDGTIMMSDPVKRRLLAIRPVPSGPPLVRRDGPLPPRQLPNRGGVPTQTHTELRSAQEGVIVFADGATQDRVSVPAGGPIAALRLVGVDCHGRAFVVLERFVELGKLEVEREVLVVTSDGDLLARRTLPEPPLVSPITELYLTPEGDLYRLAAGAESVVIERLEVLP